MLSARFLYCLKIAQFAALVVFYFFFFLVFNVHVGAEGFRHTHPKIFRAPLESIPQLHYMLEDSELGDMDVATIAALGLMIGVCAIWKKITQAVLEVRSLDGINIKKLKSMTLFAGIAVLVADSFVFCNGLLHHSMWGGADLLPCLAVTVVYIGLLVVASIEVAVLREQIHLAHSRFAPSPFAPQH